MEEPCGFLGWAGLHERDDSVYERLRCICNNMARATAESNWEDPSYCCICDAASELEPEYPTETESAASEPPEDGEYEWEKEDEDEEEESAKDEEEEMELAKGVVKQEEEKLALCAQQGDGSAMAQMAPAEHAQQPADFAARQRLIAALQQQQKDAEAAQAAAIAKADQSASLAARDARAAQVATEVAEVAAVTTAAAIKRLSNVQVKKEEDEEKGPAPLEWPEAPHPRSRPAVHRAAKRKPAVSRTAAMRAVEVEASDGIRNTDEIVSEKCPLRRKLN